MFYLFLEGNVFEDEKSRYENLDHVYNVVTYYGIWLGVIFC